MVDVAASPLFDDAGPPSGAVLALRDRTIQKTLEKRVADRESIAAFGDIAAGIAHEVKNPLGGIRGAAEILASRSEEPRTKEIAEIIVREVERIAALVDDLMVFTPGDAVSFEPVNIHRLLDEVLELLSLDPISEGVEIQRRYDPSIPELMADGDRLAQVFLNLARNALQAMAPDGGTLVVRTRMPLDHRLSDEGGAPHSHAGGGDLGHGAGHSRRRPPQARDALLHHAPRRHGARARRVPQLGVAARRQHAHREQRG